MIINGQAVKGGNRLANHLLKQENEQVQVLEISGVAANDNLHEALKDMEAVGALTQSQTGKVLYHANINPKANERLTPEQYIKASDHLMKELGFQGQPRAIVMHQKQGRQHAHLVVQLTDIEQQKLKPISNNYYKHRTVARELEQSLELEKSPRKYTGKSYSQSEAQQAKKHGKPIGFLRQDIQDAFVLSKNGKEFTQRLAKKNLTLAKGRRLVLIDRYGNAQSLTRQLKEIANSKLIEKKLKDVLERLPGASVVQHEVREFINEHKLEGRKGDFDAKKKNYIRPQEFDMVQDDFEERLDYYKQRKNGKEYDLSR